MSGLEDSDIESPQDTGRGARARSPRTSDSESEEEFRVDNLTPRSKKQYKMIKAVVSTEIAPVKRDLNKLMNASAKIKGNSEQGKKSLIELKRATTSIEERLNKAAKRDPKSDLTCHAVTKLNGIVFRQLKVGRNKEQVREDVFRELLDSGVVGPTDEDTVKKTAGKEFIQIKAHLRRKIAEDLGCGNDVVFPKAEQYLKSHNKDTQLSESSREYLTIMALGCAKFENLKPVALNEVDKTNKSKMEKNIDFWWKWVTNKYTKYEQDGYSVGDKLSNIINNVGYKKKDKDGAVNHS